jgi:hypothetical protein
MKSFRIFLLELNPLRHESIL